jgi:hypothetical protein
LTCALQDTFDLIPLDEDPVPHLQVQEHPKSVAVVDSLVPVLLEDREKTVSVKIAFFRERRITEQTLGDLTQGALEPIAQR